MRNRENFFIEKAKKKLWSKSSESYEEFSTTFSSFIQWKLARITLKVQNRIIDFF